MKLVMNLGWRPALKVVSPDNRLSKDLSQSSASNSRGATSQNILRPERDNGRDYQGKEHQDQHEWIDHSIAPRMQEVYIAAQVFRNFFRRVDFRRRLQLRRGRLVSLLAAL